MIGRRLSRNGSQDGPGVPVGGRIIYILDFIGAIGIGIKVEQDCAREEGGELNPIELGHGGCAGGGGQGGKGKTNQPSSVLRRKCAGVVAKLRMHPLAKVEFPYPDKMAFALNRSHTYL